jgi:hypothetical protein
MFRKYPEPILHKNFRSLGFSHAFCQLAEELRFHSPSDMLELRTARLLQLPGFTLHLLYEYVSFLESKSLGHYIDP